MNETNVAHLTQEKHPASQQVPSKAPDSASIQEVRLQVILATALSGAPEGQESYERGMPLKNAGLFRQAAEQFQHGENGHALTLLFVCHYGSVMTGTYCKEA